MQFNVAFSLCITCVIIARIDCHHYHHGNSRRNNTGTFGKLTFSQAEKTNANATLRGSKGLFLLLTKGNHTISKTTHLKNYLRNFGLNKTNVVQNHTNNKGFSSTTKKHYFSTNVKSNNSVEDIVTNANNKRYDDNMTSTLNKKDDKYEYSATNNKDNGTEKIKQPTKNNSDDEGAHLNRDYNSQHSPNKHDSLTPMENVGNANKHYRPIIHLGNNFSPSAPVETDSEVRNNNYKPSAPLENHSNEIYGLKNRSEHKIIGTIKTSDDNPILVDTRNENPPVIGWNVNVLERNEPYPYPNLNTNHLDSTTGKYNSWRFGHLSHNPQTHFNKQSFPHYFDKSKHPDEYLHNLNGGNRDYSGEFNSSSVFIKHESEFNNQHSKIDQSSKEQTIDHGEHKYNVDLSYGQEDITTERVSDYKTRKSKKHRHKTTTTAKPVAIEQSFNPVETEYSTIYFHPSLSKYHPEWLPIAPINKSLYKPYQYTASLFYGPLTYINEQPRPAYSYRHKSANKSFLGFLIGVKAAELFRHSQDPRYENATYEIKRYRRKDHALDHRNLKAEELTQCGVNVDRLCVQNSFAICTKNGTIMCVTNLEETTPCDDPKNACFASTVNCTQFGDDFNWTKYKMSCTLRNFTSTEHFILNNNIPQNYTHGKNTVTITDNDNVSEIKTQFTRLDNTENPININSRNDSLISSDHHSTSNNQNRILIRGIAFTNLNVPCVSNLTISGNSSVFKNLSLSDFGDALSNRVHYLRFCVSVWAVPMPLDFVGNGEGKSGNPVVQQLAWGVLGKFVNHIWTG